MEIPLLSLLVAFENGIGKHQFHLLELSYRYESLFIYLLLFVKPLGRIICRFGNFYQNYADDIDLYLTFPRNSGLTSQEPVRD